MIQYLNLLEHILDNGTPRNDRTNTGTIGVFGTQDRYDLNDGFPVVTTKQLNLNAVISELLWFLEGSGDELRLKEILYGDRHSNKSTIWTANANADYWKPKAKFDGDLGRVYGVNWRDWQTPVLNPTTNQIEIKHTDQLLMLIENIKKDPYSRRHILSAWNVGELDQMALPPCHLLAQFYIADEQLSCQLYQRSADTFLGVPFNIASYALLTHMIAHVCNLKVGDFIHTIGDAHLYIDHLDQAKEQIQRTPLPLPTIWLNPEIKDITSFKMEDIKIINYIHHKKITAKMSV